MARGRGSVRKKKKNQGSFALEDEEEQRVLKRKRVHSQS